MLYNVYVLYIHIFVYVCNYVLYYIRHIYSHMEYGRNYNVCLGCKGEGHTRHFMLTAIDTDTGMSPGIGSIARELKKITAYRPR